MSFLLLYFQHFEDDWMGEEVGQARRGDEARGGDEARQGEVTGGEEK